MSELACRNKNDVVIGVVVYCPGMAGHDFEALLRAASPPECRFRVDVCHSVSGLAQKLGASTIIPDLALLFADSPAELAALNAIAPLMGPADLILLVPEPHFGLAALKGDLHPRIVMGLDCHARTLGHMMGKMILRILARSADTG